MQLEGKRIILTGGGSGIGAETVKTFARKGASLVSLDLDENANGEIVAAAADLGPGSISAAVCDISNQAQVATH